MKLQTKVAIGIVGTGVVASSLPVAGAVACVATYSAYVAAFNAVVGASIITPVVIAGVGAKTAAKAYDSLDNENCVSLGNKPPLDWEAIDWVETILTVENAYDVEIPDIEADALYQQFLGVTPSSEEIYQAFLAL